MVSSTGITVGYWTPNRADSASREPNPPYGTKHTETATHSQGRARTTRPTGNHRLTSGNRIATARARATSDTVIDTPIRPLSKPREEKIGAQ